MIPQRTASYEEEGRLRPTDTLARKRIRRYLFPPRVCFRTWQLPFAAYPASLSRACAFSLYFFKPFAVPDCFISSFFSHPSLGRLFLTSLVLLADSPGLYPPPVSIYHLPLFDPFIVSSLLLFLLNSSRIFLAPSSFRTSRLFHPSSSSLEPFNLRRFISRLSFILLRLLFFPPLSIRSSTLLLFILLAFFPPWRISNARHPRSTSRVFVPRSFSP